MKKFLNYFSHFEKLLWLFSTIIIFASYFLFSNDGVLSLIASLIGVTSLIFAAKANPVGPFLMIIFSILYSIISFSFRYYGEMITYLGMTLPMSAFSLAAWLKNPYKNNKSEVEVNSLNGKDIMLMALYTAVVTLIFYFILKYFNTANLLFSTLSIATSFAAAYLTFRRSAYYALAYAANDVILIVLWCFATAEKNSYVSVVICFVIFLINDLYGFFNWKRIKHKQRI